MRKWAVFIYLNYGHFPYYYLLGHVVSRLAYYKNNTVKGRRDQTMTLINNPDIHFHRDSFSFCVAPCVGVKTTVMGFDFYILMFTVIRGHILKIAFK